MSIDLQPFCATSDSRKYLREPFHINGHTFATDGRLMIRVPRRADIPEPQAAVPDKAVEQIQQWFTDISALPFEPAPTFELPPPELIRKEECEDCEGTGHEHDCPDCSCECQSCGGSGEAEIVRDVSAHVGKLIFNIEFIRKIADLPGLQLAIDAPTKTGAMYFRFDGGDGLLMSRRVEAPQHIDIIKRDLAAVG